MLCIWSHGVHAILPKGISAVSRGRAWRPTKRLGGDLLHGAGVAAPTAPRNLSQQAVEKGCLREISSKRFFNSLKTAWACWSNLRWVQAISQSLDNRLFNRLESAWAWAHLGEFTIQSVGLQSQSIDHAISCRFQAIEAEVWVEHGLAQSKQARVAQIWAIGPFLRQRYYYITLFESGCICVAALGVQYWARATDEMTHAC